jgi:hypothetical protein
MGERRENIAQTEITLGRVAEHLAMLEIGCRTDGTACQRAVAEPEVRRHKCDRYGRLSVARLIKEHGAEKGLNELPSHARSRLPAPGRPLDLRSLRRLLPAAAEHLLPTTELKGDSHRGAARDGRRGHCRHFALSGVTETQGAILCRV